MNIFNVPCTHEFGGNQRISGLKTRKRITVELILRKLGEGATEIELLEAYPRLKREDIRAVIRVAEEKFGLGPRNS